MLRTYRNILVIRFSSLGDLVLTTPVYRELKKVYPCAKLTLLTAQGFGEVLAKNPYIDRFIFHTRQESTQALKQLIQELQQEQFDLVYDLHGSLRSRWIRWQLRRNSNSSPEIWKINKRSFRRFLLVKFHLNLLQGSRAQREHWLIPLQKQVEEQLDATTELFPDEKSQNKMAQKMSEAQLEIDKFLCIGPSASSPLKCWPLAYYQELIATLLRQGWKIVILGGSQETEPRQLKAYFGNQIIDWAGQLTLFESASLLKKAAFAISNDTAMIHIAEAMNTPAISIFGPTVREFGYSPFLLNSHLVEVESMNLPCRPCTRTGQGKCKLVKEKLCLTEIKPQQVLLLIPKLSSQ